MVAINVIDTAKQVLEAVKSVIGHGPHKLHQPFLPKSNPDNNVLDSVLRSGHLSAGPIVAAFESELARFIGAKHCVATVNGTAALHAASAVIYGNCTTEIYIPSLTFIATANPLIELRHKVRLVDYNEPCDISVDILGHEAKTGGTLRDCAQALGTIRADGQMVGSSGTCIFSFNQNKIITTGGGGAIVTDDAALYKELKHLTTTARIPDRWRVAHDAIGWNYRMPDLNAAVGMSQLAHLPFILKCKRALAHKYQDALKGIDGVSFWEEPVGTKSNYWLPSLKADSADLQQAILWALHKEGIQARMLPTPLHMLPMYEQPENRIFTATESIWNSVVCLPGSPHLGMNYAKEIR